MTRIHKRTYRTLICVLSSFLAFAVGVGYGRTIDDGCKPHGSAWTKYGR